MEHKTINNLFHSVSTNSANKFNSIMNSPNFGNQQILLQSCCFFDSERSQTPNATNTVIKDFNIKLKNRNGSPKIPQTKGKLYHYKSLYSDLKTDSNIILSNRDKKNEDNFIKIKKLRNDNRALKETIKNLTSQLDRVCSIAETAKNNEISTLQLNNCNEKEKNNLINKIENLTKEKEELKKEIEKKE